MRKIALVTGGAKGIGRNGIILESLSNVLGSNPRGATIR